MEAGPNERYRLPKHGLLRLGRLIEQLLRQNYQQRAKEESITVPQIYEEETHNFQRHPQQHTPLDRYKSAKTTAKPANDRSIESSKEDSETKKILKSH